MPDNGDIQNREVGGVVRRLNSAATRGFRPYSQIAYLCPIQFCGKKFIKVENLRSHIRTHTQEKLYICNPCDKAFSRSDNLALHLQSHHSYGTSGDAKNLSGDHSEGNPEKKEDQPQIAEGVSEASENESYTTMLSSSPCPDSLAPDPLPREPADETGQAYEWKQEPSKDNDPSPHVPDESSLVDPIFLHPYHPTNTAPILLGSGIFHTSAVGLSLSPHTHFVMPPPRETTSPQGGPFNPLPKAPSHHHSSPLEDVLKDLASPDIPAPRRATTPPGEIFSHLSVDPQYPLTSNSSPISWVTSPSPPPDPPHSAVPMPYKTAGLQDDVYSYPWPTASSLSARNPNPIHTPHDHPSLPEHYPPPTLHETASPHYAGPTNYTSLLPPNSQAPEPEATGAPIREPPCWRLNYKIGTGACGNVFLENVHIPGMKSPELWAVKRIPRHLPNFTFKRYQAEIMNLQALASHEWFIKFNSTYEDTHYMYIAMEYIPMGDMSKSFADNYRWKESDTKVVIKQLLHGLAVMHQEGITHRDLKPENIFLYLPENEAHVLRVKIGDFGTSKRIPHSNASTYLKTTTGTQGYMAPEMHDTSKLKTNRVDIWSLGCVLFRMSAGHLLFNDPFEVWKYTLTASSSPLALDNIGFSNPFISFLRGILQPIPEDRPSARDCLKHD